MRYVTSDRKEFEPTYRRGHPFLRHDFRPTVYVVLTLDQAIGLEKHHG